jgi:hypothetical protein
VASWKSGKKKHFNLKIIHKWSIFFATGVVSGVFGFVTHKKIERYEFRMLRE